MNKVLQSEKGETACVWSETKQGLTHHLLNEKTKSKDLIIFTKNKSFKMVS